MQVIFISQCTDKALKRTRRILDSFANRVGDRTWKTEITLVGLNAVRESLSSIACKNTAVACHRMKSGSLLLEWTVGRAVFSNDGTLPVSRSSKKVKKEIPTCFEVMKPIVALSALFHDWGKSNKEFQKKLRDNKCDDAYRHEYISAVWFKSFVMECGVESDDGWLRAAQEKIILKEIREEAKSNPCEGLPPLATIISWLVISHHKLPVIPLNDDGLYNESGMKSEFLYAKINSKCGFNKTNQDPEYYKDFENSFGVDEANKIWLNENAEKFINSVKRWAKKLEYENSNEDGFLRSILKKQYGEMYPFLMLARLALMLGDHHYSSQLVEKAWAINSDCYANTTSEKQLKQSLEEHLLGVQHHAVSIAHNFNNLFKPQIKSKKLSFGHTSKEYQWQDLATNKIKEYYSGGGCFVVNMASTGTGKTLGNAKIMQGLSGGEGVRYSLALGLRTLTLQTGDEYKNKIGKIKDSDMAVLVGSEAVKFLHTQDLVDKSEDGDEFSGSSSSESLYNEDDICLESNGIVSDVYLDVLFKNKKKLKELVNRPLVVCTIDHLMASTETVRGGKYIVPMLRMATSDLVIDEIDDFNDQDLLGISRLIHLAASFGRRVVISSATTPKVMIDALFEVYKLGYQKFVNLKLTENNKIDFFLVDEFSSHIVNEQSSVEDFIEKRVDSLSSLPQKRRGMLRELEILSEDGFAEACVKSILDMHKKNKCETGLDNWDNISFGLIRMANVSTAIWLSRKIMNTDFGNVGVALMCNHSKQTVLIRNAKEKYLDAVMTRKQVKEEENYKNDPSILNAIKKLKSNGKKEFVFILVSTPVEEVGRDHDFDWAIIEPSSYRSIIQCSGRVFRHRKETPSSENVTILNNNFKALKQKNKVVFARPGFETEGYSLKSRFLMDTLELCYVENITSIPRVKNYILPPKKDMKNCGNFVLLELNALKRRFNLDYSGSHVVFEKKDYKDVGSWVCVDQGLWLLGNAQKDSKTRFRSGLTESLVLTADYKFKEKRNYKWVEMSSMNCKHVEVTFKNSKNVLWVDFNFKNLLENLTKSVPSIKSNNYYWETVFGEIPLVYRQNDEKEWKYSDVFGIERCDRHE